jgi:tRNA (guanine37-N1)-methyltransferase
VQIGVITLFPEMFEALRVGGITARALQRGLLDLKLWNPREFTENKHRRVDDRPYGGGAGMVMQVQPLRTTLRAAIAEMGEDTHVVYLSPQGKRLDQAGVNNLLNHPRLLFLAGRYEGIDERVILHDIDEAWSIGDYVLSGGELAAMVMIDALTRWLPEALGDAESARADSFYAGLLDYPHYTRPEYIADMPDQEVPAVLLNGHHAEIDRWRRKQALGRTWQKRPDLLEKLSLTTTQQQLLAEFINELKQEDMK